MPKGSPRGKNYNVLSVEELFWIHVDYPEDNSICWNWNGTIDPDGRAIFYYKRKAHIASRWAWINFVEPIPSPKLLVCHICDNPACVNYIEHLYVGTHSTNRKDLFAHGGGRQDGERNNYSKLTKLQVLDIRNCYDNDEPLADIAERYEVTIATISAIGLCKRWTNLGVEY